MICGTRDCWLFRNGLVTVLVSAIFLFPISELRADDDSPTEQAGLDDVSLTRDLTELRKEQRLVGLAATVVVDGQVVAYAADGERKQGSGVAIETDDRWHLGSITKSITATMIARLIESGQMTWSDTVGARFPDAAIHNDWKPVTLRQLLTHTAGAPANFSLKVRLQRPKLGDACMKARRQAVLDVLAKEPTKPPGTNFSYSNVGYTIAGAMAEQATGVPWEDLVRREVFEPLQLAHTGFGPPVSPSKTLDQPRGHRAVFGRKISVGDKEDNTPIMGPAGTVHMSLRDLSQFAEEHMRGELGMGTLLDAATFRQLHTPELKDYACGWVKREPSYEIPYTAYWHNGSNTMWYALVVFIPDKRMVVAVAANDGDMRRAELAAWELLQRSSQRIDAADDRERRKSLASGAFPKKSPFSGVRWRDTRADVKIGEEWFELVSLDDISAGEIIKFTRDTYGDKWQKRFEEDLFEALFRMGYDPRDSVKLVVQPVGVTEPRTLDDVAMTEENRKAIRAAAADK